MLGFSGALALEIEPKDTSKLPMYVKQSYEYIAGMLNGLAINFE